MSSAMASATGASKTGKEHASTAWWEKRNGDGGGGGGDGCGGGVELSLEGVVCEVARQLVSVWLMAEMGWGYGGYGGYVLMMQILFPAKLMYVGYLSVIDCVRCLFVVFIMSA